MTAYYNEFDPYAAAWLRNLITAGHIADGVVDTRSIEDVRPSDLAGFTQCHFFAGVGVWSHALRAAGWPDDRPVWTGSCPCQPFSAAGQGAGFADERHLWPAFGHLIAQCKPAIVLGEQVASKDVDVWIDLVHADLEALGYAFGSVPFPSAGIGAPHIRDRNYWMAHTNNTGLEGRLRVPERGHGFIVGQGVMAGGLEHTGLDHDAGKIHASSAGQSQAHRPTDIAGRSGVPFGRMANADSEQYNRGRHIGPGWGIEYSIGSTTGIERPGPTNGFWRDADWLGCTDGKWRPVEPGTFPLAHGAASRVGRLRAYGNAINAEAARCWIEAVMECQP